jgi:hypothetical protein
LEFIVVMPSLSLGLTAFAVAAVLLAAASGSFAFAQKADVPAQAQSDRSPPLPPDRHHGQANGTNNRLGPYANEIRPSDREKAIDRKINNICRGC